MNGLNAKPSREMVPGDLVEIVYPGRELVLELLELPEGQVSRKECERYYRVVRETRVPRGTDLAL